MILIIFKPNFFPRVEVGMNKPNDVTALIIHTFSSVSVYLHLDIVFTLYIGTYERNNK